MNASTANPTGARILRIAKWLLWGLRWLSIAIFGVLFCAGVFFKLPWKIVVCLAVIPAVGIFVPRRIQPWCWAVLTAVLLGTAGWIFWPRADSGRWRTYRYDEALVRLLQARRIDGAPNAAALYQQVLSEYDESIFMPGELGYQVEWQTFHDPWSIDDFPELNEWMGPIEPAVPLLLEAAAIDQCRFPIAHDTPALRTQLRRINQLKAWGRWLVRSANSDLQAGRHEQALNKQLAVLGIARHLYQQQTLFDQAGGFFLELMAARSLKRYALEHAAGDAELDRIRTAMEQVEPNWPKGWDGIVETEKLMAKNLAALLYQIDDRGRTRLHRNPVVSVGEGLGYPVPPFLQHESLVRATVLAMWLSIPVSPNNTARLIDRRFDKYADLAQRGTPARPLPVQYAWRLGLNPTSAVDWLARHQMRFYAALDGQHTSHLALGRATAIMIELRRYHLKHGRWPAHIDALIPQIDTETLIDPVSDTPFVYGTTQTEFYLYSLGRNAIDDHGLNDPKKNRDDIVFWPLEPPASGFR